MNRKLTSEITILLIVFVLFGFSSQSSDVSPSEHPRKIVVFKERFDKEADQDALLNNLGALKIKRLALINGMAVHLPPQAEKTLKKRDEVLRIDEDLVIDAHEKKAAGKPKPPQLPQELTWGIDRIGADWAWEITKGSAIRVAILDTGIDLDHPDLQDNIKGNVNMIKPKKSGDDDNGHGTHIAGIVAAVDNEIGVIGTGPEISLYAVKVLDKKGRGWLSDLIDAVEWCINNNIQVINMSFGSANDNPSFHEAINKAHLAGITLIASAGNNGEIGGSIDYPAKYPETIAVSAVDQYGDFASFSSHGPEIDLTAPGVDIKSCYIDGSYEIMNGTSMSAPHVTGIVALILTTPSLQGYDYDRDGSWDPEEIRTKLKESAEPLSLPPFQQGAGLARADRAIR